MPGLPREQTQVPTEPVSQVDKSRESSKGVYVMVTVNLDTTQICEELDL